MSAAGLLREGTDRLDPPPVFIVGAPRSGTTLLQILLDLHPELAIPPESHIFSRFADVFDAYGDLTLPQNLRRFVADLLGDAWIRRWGLRVTVEEFCQTVSAPSVRGVLVHLFALYARQEGKTRWGEKTPNHALHLQMIRRIFPEAQFIHLIRDGRDVAESLGRVYFGKKSIAANAHRWRRHVMACHALTCASPKAVLEIKYCDLVQDPKGILSRVQAFLKLGHGDAADVTHTARRQDYVRSGSHHQSLREPLSAQRVGAFRSRLSLREIEIFETIAGDTLRRYGYPLMTPGAARLHAGERLRFFLQDYVGRYLRKLMRPQLYPEIIRDVHGAAQLQWRRGRCVVRRQRIGR